MSERQATVLFVNVSGSAELYAAVGDRAALQAVERCLQLAAQAVVAGGGRVLKRYGHGLTAVFGGPDAAAIAAAETQAGVEEAPALGGVQLGLRIGFHHGPVVQQGSDVFGDNVNLAARLAGLAKKGEIITSVATAGLLHPTFRSRVRNLYPIQVKGKSDEVALAELMWQSEAGTSLAAAALARPAALSLRLEYRGRTFLRRRSDDSIRIGRDAECSLVVDHEQVSRSHCTIERRQAAFVLKDHSMNGTYVTYEGERERRVRRGELVLGKHGWITLGRSRAAAPDAIEFYCE